MLPVLLEEAAALSPVITHRSGGSTAAQVVLRGALNSVYTSRLWLSASLPEERAAGHGPKVAARAIAGGVTAQLAEALTEGPVRYRIGWADGGKRRSEVVQIAEAVSVHNAALINDPSDAPWQVVLREGPDHVAAEWQMELDDPRFAYRSGDVPAASHPTIAAALAFVAGVEAGEVVWDPFVGSGLELCERALRGPYKLLVGTDLDPRALDVARKNLEACGVHNPDLRVHDASKGAPQGVRPTLIISNPPMGRRVHREADLGEMLATFVRAAARSLSKGGGRLVWVSPFPRFTREVAENAGFAMRRAHIVDMGGFDAEIQALTLG